MGDPLRDLDNIFPCWIANDLFLASVIKNAVLRRIVNVIYIDLAAI